ncbi:DUF2490 domain-containing protein [Aridibaculum aurantiacum]|uniref:DUF2490 domain-containing protein n=1 Tax=Aridibaculum aurantiacum TaxID=2810307 RepID=UPI001A96AB48|nr:DUF2490 domain-containing protein [Aridibaculum aurantiacum]
MKPLLFFILLLVSHAVLAQADNELWTRLQVNKTISKHLLFAFDYQHRRSNGTGEGKALCSEQLLNSYRLWLHYKPDSSTTIIVSPVAYFQNHSFSINAETATKVDDVRSMAGIAKNWRIGNAATTHRVLYEITVTGANVSAPSVRHRYRLQNSFVLPLVKKGTGTVTSYQVSNEVLFRTLNGSSGFDQNRLYNGIRLKNKHHELNAGYQLSIQKGLQVRNQFLIYLTINI